MTDIDVFEEMKENEIEAKRIASFTAKKGVMNDDGTPYFHTEYLIRNDLKMSEEEIRSNKQWFDASENTEEAPEAGGAPGGAPGGMGGAAPAPAAAEAPAVGTETVEGGEVAGTGQL